METIRFDELGLMPQILRGIEEMGFEETTPIQAKAIPVVMEGSDSFSYQGTCDPGGGRASESGQIYARH